ncbi:MAG TPA: alcohol dehydrogenase catalytic domain-containing protein [Acidimicrobiales bacterium]|nr:alcohol dehydrogenase catalytic domain-containing protein [Acidimicrobiales bacterium]
MKALVFTGLGVVEVLDMPDVVAETDEVVVHVDRAGICGSELHGISTPGFRVPPLIMGHEFVGHTSDGRRVAVNPLVTCGTCDLCLSGKTQVCRSRTLLGVHRAGGFAERVVVPTSSLHDLPDGIDFDRATLIEPVANAVHAWSLASNPRGQRIGIIGCGPIGLACLEVALHEGASSVACADLSVDRRAVAESIGAQVVGESLEGEFDVIFDAVGSSATRLASVGHLVPGGVTVWLGLAAPETGFDATHVVRFEKIIKGSFAYSDAEFSYAIDMAKDLDLSWWTTYGLDEGATIFNALMNGQTTPIKALLRP